MALDQHVPTPVYGPFCRLRTPGDGQNAATAVKQALSGEIWGRTRYGQPSATVEAYGRRLRAGESGIEFYALTPPDDQWDPRPSWSTPDAHLVIDVEESGREVAKLQVAFVRITQDLLHGIDL